jgi:endonuclease YncB( thermonuclease family)
MLRRVVTVLAVISAVLATAAAPAAAATVACRPGAGSPMCQVWYGKVSWVPDGDTPLVDVYGDATSKLISVRMIGVQAMEQSV